MTKNLITAAVAVAMLASGAAGAQPTQGFHGPAAGLNGRGCYSGERYGDCTQRRRAEQQSHHQYVWRNGRYEDQNAGAAVAGGILGFMLGAAIAGSSSDRDYYQAHRYNRGWRTRCRAAYPGFDYRNGTYLAPDGYRHYCTR